MSSLRYKVVLNPTAGKGNAAERIPEVNSLFRAHGLDYEIFLTNGVGHAAELACNSSREGFDVIISAGGDGTANEVINGLMTSFSRGESLPALGNLSIGRGNDFAYGADIPGNLPECVKILVQDNRRPMDVGRVTGGDYPQGRFFGNGIGIGFDTIVGLEAARMKHVHGFMAYVFGAVKTLIKYPDAPNVVITCDADVYAQPSHQISIMNGKRMGGTFFMAPQAKNYDGLLDMCLASRLTRRDMISLVGHYIKGTQDRHPLIKTACSSRYEIKAPNGGLVVHADGETICTNGNNLIVECLSNQLMIICDVNKDKKKREGIA
jgi:diacylglycerol kinase (ATP)